MTEIRNVTTLSIPTSMRVEAVPVLCWVVVNDDDAAVEPIRSFVVELAANGTSPSTRRSYCHDLLRWWRFCDAVGTTWDQAGTSEVRDFVRWMQNHPNPQRRRAGKPRSRPPAGSINAVTGKTYLRDGYAPRTINHALSVLSAFYAFMYEAGLGPWNPVPRPHNKHRLPVRRARYRQKLPTIQPRAIPEENLQDLFAALRNDRDRALVALALSSGARAGELLSVSVLGMDPGQGVVSIEPKGGMGSRIWIPAAPESFVWIARYTATRPPYDEDGPLWLSLRAPHSPLDYFALRQVLERANSRLGTNYTWHDFRHTFSHRILADDRMTLTDAQALMRHRNLDTLKSYSVARLDELVSALHRHLATPPPAAARSSIRYDAADLAVLFPGLQP